MHGDLHQRNILVLNDDSDYAVIDYDSVTKNFLLFDQAYLELNVYMQIMKEYNLEEWTEGIRYVFELENEPRTSVEYANIIAIQKRIFSGIEQWYDEEYPLCKDSCYVQFQLARAAAGINYLSKSAITDDSEQIKYIIYIGYGLKKIFELLQYKWNKNDVTRIVNQEKDSEYVKSLWNECGKLRNEYIKVLITDDLYSVEKRKKLHNIGEVKWQLIVDVGAAIAPEDLITEISPIIKKYNRISYVNKDNVDDNSIQNSTALLEAKLGKQMSDFEHWIMFRKYFLPVIRTVCSNEPFKAVLFVLDLPNSDIIRERFLAMLWEEELLRKGSRFVCFGKKSDLQLETVELERKNIRYFQHSSMDLEDLASVIDVYGLHREQISKEIRLPSIESLDGVLTQEEWNDYSAVIEIVYQDCEQNSMDYTDGESFYKGNEISWLDLAQRKDIEWKEYGKWKELILKKLQTERIAECRLSHGAGAGGTTLSRRLMWDIKDSYPTVRVKKYNKNTATVIVELYRKTGKTVFVVCEMGSTVITEEEFETMKRVVNAQSCRALFLRIERSSLKEENAEIYLSEELEDSDARKFCQIYSSMTDIPGRISNLNSITYDFYRDEWRGQRCPFFYGFYTYQEEYIGLKPFLKASVERCDDNIKNILIDLSLVTLYSQNICMPFQELTFRLELEEVNLVEIYQILGEGIEKILVVKDDGFRICHPLIAKKLLELIYDDYKQYNEQLYHATIHYINSMNSIYEEIDREYLDKTFRELFIDRSYIDGEQQKFALLITELEKISLQTKIFELLINMYPDNSHYYNHLGRLEIYQEDNMQFDKAIANLNKALSIAKRKEQNLVPHYTTLGCIYSKKVIFELGSTQKSVSKLLDTIKVDFGNASECFEKARELKENSTYAYFPNILMICNVVKKISKVTRQNLKSLLKETEFEKWYDCYCGVAIQLFEQMKRSCDEELRNELCDRAARDILCLQENFEGLEQRLNIKLHEGKILEYNNLSRCVTMLLYTENEFKWENMDSDKLVFAEKQMECVLESGEYNQNDVSAWFNIYRQMESFEVDKAKRYILDYMTDGYYKSYLLWLLNFYEYEQGMVNYSKVQEHLNSCRYNSKLVENSIRTTRNIDVYSTIDKGFAMRRMGSLKGENGEYTNLKTFKGHITDISGTVKGVIQMDELNEVSVTFTPSITVDNEKREFSRADISAPVTFNLVFTYSGYKAWNVKKI